MERTGDKIKRIDFRVGPDLFSALMRRAKKGDRTPNPTARRYLEASFAPSQAINSLRGKLQSFEAKIEMGDLDGAEKVLQDGLESYSRACEKRELIEKILEEYNKLDEVAEPAEKMLQCVQEKKSEIARATYSELADSKYSRLQRELQLNGST